MPKHAPKDTLDSDASTDLALRICSGGNVLEQLERWAHDLKASKED